MEFVKSEEKQILIDGLKINYKQIGDGNIPIILLHGWGVSSDKYLELAKYLSQFSIFNFQFSIVIPDLPGFGKSDKPCLPDRQAPEAWRVDNYAEFIKEFIQSIDSKGSPWIMIGHSFGGRIAIKFAAKYPEKLKALILTGAAGIKRSPSVKQKIFFFLAKIGKAVFSLPLINYFKKPAEKMLYKAAREKDYYQAQGIMKEVFKKVIDEDLTLFLDKIKTPTLLVWGAKDHSTPLSDAYIMKEKISAQGGPATGGENCELKIIGEANHSLPYQIPKKFAKIAMEFIKNK